PPPSSTPFPYTTLFRSLGDRGRPVAGEVPATVDLLDDLLRRARARAEHRVRHADQGDECRVRRLPVAVRLAAEDRGRLAAVHEADRKSTRLNSSHVSIS